MNDIVNEMDLEFGIWKHNSGALHGYDSKLSDKLVQIFNTNTVVDLGCGMGHYVDNLRNNNIECDGYDGNPNTVELIKGVCNIINLAFKFNLAKKYNWVLCLEVGEHIPEEYEKTFIENIHSHNINGIVLSWGIPGQTGYGHVNCKSNEYVKNIFVNELNYTNDIILENELRESATFGWFKNSITVFKK